MDPGALFKLTYGLFAIGSRRKGKINAQISNTVIQVADQPPRVAVCINKKELTHEYIRAGGVFAASILAESVPVELVRLFGFKSGRDVEKFASVPFKTGVTGCPIVAEHSVAAIEAKVAGSLDAGTHTIFLGQVVGAEVLREGKALTYAFYREHLKGQTHPNAPSYGVYRTDSQRAGGGSKPALRRYVCGVCGYVYDPAVGVPESGIGPGVSFEDLPAGWVCPVCGAAKDKFGPE